MFMKALKLRLEPTKEQYKILDEMFGKWASICNRFNKYNYQKNMKEEEIKEKLKPKQGIQKIQFSQTQTNQQAKKDNADLIRAMDELRKQKERELASLEERYDTINKALKNEKYRDIDPLKHTRLRPKGWRNFKTKHHWESELEKLDRQIKNKRKTIEKIEKKKIYFKPKRVGLWSTSFEISFKS